MNDILGAITRMRIRRNFWKLPPRIIVVLLTWLYRKDFAYSSKIEVVNGLYRLKQFYASSQDVVYVFHPQRISRYFVGIQERLSKLFYEYCLDSVDDLNRGGYIVDIGSNVGELCLIPNRMFPGKFKFTRFEPSDNDCRAAERNLEGIIQIEIRNPLWFESTTMQFFNATKQAIHH